MKKITLFLLMLGICLSSRSQSWSALISGVDAGGINSLCVDPISDLLYVGGAFQNASGTTAYYIASWNGNSWAAVGSGMNSYVFALEIYNGELYAGGSFNFAGGNPIAYLAKWNGSIWNPVSTLVNTSVQVLKVHNGALYGVTSSSQIFKWDGSNLTYITGPGGIVSALESYGNDLIAGGTGSNLNYIAKWDGSVWSPVGNGFNAYVASLKSHDGYLYAGGEFTFSGGTPANSIARWNGTTWSALGGGITCSGFSSVFAILGNNNNIYAGGNFCQAGGHAANFIAQWNGSNWSTLSSGVNNGVEALAIYKNDLYEGGGSQYAGGTLVNYIAKWGLSTEINDNISTSFISPFPNPFLNTFSIIGTSEKGLIIIHDLVGKEILRQSTALSETKINLENFSSGIYLLQYSDEKTTLNFKVIKK